VAQAGEVVVNRQYGLANLEEEAPITANTMFDIGSTQKQFIAAAVLLLVEDERLALADDVHAYIPELPDYGHTITVDHLLTHTSGLRDWTAIPQLMGEREDALTLILRQRSLDFAPGEEWSYSNSGYVLLKEIVARTTGMPFSAFAHERLFDPLGMETTAYADDVRDVEGRALAYERDGDGWKLDILAGNERGDGGALLTTAGDLLIWNEALTNASLGAFVTGKLQEPAKLNNGRELNYARGLFLDEHPASKVVWHSGSAAGYKSLLARLPALDLSFAILCNSGEGALGERFADHIIEMFIPDGDGSEAGGRHRDIYDDALAYLPSARRKLSEARAKAPTAKATAAASSHEGRSPARACAGIVVMTPMGMTQVRIGRRKPG
jgi:CubicO group peptidase (beta-lactamase class C family)